MASPTSRIPREYKNFASVVCLDASIALSRFTADFSPIRSSCTSSGKVRWKISTGVFSKSASTSCSINLSPRPSISIALRDAKCFSACFLCAPQISPPVQRATASSSSFSTCESHTGHTSGKTMSLASSGRLAATTETT